MTDLLPAAAPAETAPNLGAVFTRDWVVDMILDLGGYSPDADLATLHAVEPSAGHGAFVVAMARRVAQSCARFGRPFTDARTAISAFDIDPQSTEICRVNTEAALRAEGVDKTTACDLARSWVKTDDFLLVAPELRPADWVIGNPPYVRVEEVDKVAMAEYRTTWTTMTGRADLYVGFIEAGLAILKPEGRVAYICADRWMRNRYGAALRSLIEHEHSMDACVVLHDVDAFEESVAAYPAVTVLRKGAQGPVMVCEAREAFGQAESIRLRDAWRTGPGPVQPSDGFEMTWTSDWFVEGNSWPSGPPQTLSRLSVLEKRLPLLEDTGVKVSVGVATGADDIFVQPPGRVEPDRELKAVSAKEIVTGQIRSAGLVLVNPWTQSGLADLSEHPRLRRFLNRNKIRLKDRYVAKNNPAVWWRTIDRIHPDVARQPKLLIPDLKDRIHPVLDRGDYYPLHNLYYITSNTWDLRVLGGLLMSRIANDFVEAYSVRMASGYMRVSAQYLRLIRVPQFDDIDESTREALAKAFDERDTTAASLAAETIYGLTPPPSGTRLQ
jgi:adenine-specific DNA-methyltransferase